MSDNSSTPTRRSVLAAGAASAAAAAASVLPMRPAAAAPSSPQSQHGDPPMNTSDAIRPFSIQVSDAALADLRRRIAATNWPEQETVADASQGVQLPATTRALASYGETQHDWRKVEARLNALPQFVTADRRSRHPLHPCPLDAAECAAHHRHPWLARLRHRAAQDRGAADRSRRARRQRLRRLRHRDSLAARPRLLGQAHRHRLGSRSDRPGLDHADGAPRHTHCFVAQGGDWGNAITEQMALIAPPGLLGIHTNMAATVPDDIAAALAAGSAGTSSRPRGRREIRLRAARLLLQASASATPRR